MVNKKLMYLFLCGMLCMMKSSEAMVNWDNPSDRSMLRFIIVAGAAIGTTSWAIRTLQTKAKREFITDNDSVPAVVFCGYGVGCLVTWAYKKPFEYPFMLFESGLYNTFNLLPTVGKYIYSSTLHMGKSIGRSASQGDAYFLWPTACASLAAGVLYYRYYYKKTEEDRKSFQTVKETCHKQSITITVLSQQVAQSDANCARLNSECERLKERVRQSEQPGGTP